jgi:hypothetical protein
MMDKLEF